MFLIPLFPTINFLFHFKAKLLMDCLSSLPSVPLLSSTYLSLTKFTLSSIRQDNQ